jgi:hypothetical protein
VPASSTGECIGLFSFSNAAPPDAEWKDGGPVNPPRCSQFPGPQRKTGLKDGNCSSSVPENIGAQLSCHGKKWKEAVRFVFE